jgi:hypothetical protein
VTRRLPLRLRDEAREEVEGGKGGKVTSRRGTRDEISITISTGALGLTHFPFSSFCLSWRDFQSFSRLFPYSTSTSARRLKKSESSFVSVTWESRRVSRARTWSASWRRRSRGQRERDVYIGHLDSWIVANCTSLAPFLTQPPPPPVPGNSFMSESLPPAVLG